MARDLWTVIPARVGPTTPVDRVDGDVDGALLTGFAGELPDHVELRGSRLDRVRAPGARLHAWHLSDVDAVGCDLAGVSLTGSSLVRVAFTGCRLTGGGMEGGSAKDLAVTDVQADGLTLRFAAVSRAAFTSCSLRELDLTGTMLDHVTFTDCDLTGAVMRELVVKEARFVRCTMVGITGSTRLSGATIDSRALGDLSASLALECGISVDDA